jgi:dihydrofolate reductase
MRRICYQVAMSLDGFIAGPDGEFDWIVADPEVDFAAMFARFDTFLMGRLTFEVTQALGYGSFPGKEVVVVSKTLKAADHPGVTILDGDLAEGVRRLQAAPGKDIWLYGGGALFRGLLDLDLVDTVEPAIVPVLLGGGVRLLPERKSRAPLTLTGRRVYEKSGIVLLEYAVERGGRAGA